jgi:hypothetical protein
MSSSSKTSTTSASIGHVDCSKGICDVAFLAACLDAASDSVMGADDAARLLNTCQAAVVGGMSLVDSSVAARIMAIQLQRTFHGLSLLHDDEPVTPSPSHQSSVQLGKIIKEMKRIEVEDMKWHFLPEWIADVSKKVCMELCAAWERVSNCEQPTGNEYDDNSDASPRSTAVFHLFNVIGCLLTFESMEVKDVSYSPIPISVALDEPIVQELLRGMVVDTTTTITSEDHKLKPHASPLSVAVGVALLRVLSGVPQSYSQRPIPVPMTLIKTGSGYNGTNNVKMSIFIGRKPSTVGSSIVNGISVDEFIGKSADKISSNPLLLWDMDTVTKMEANLDDITGETLACIIELLLNHGAIDAWVTPIVMKKGRPAHTLHCLCKDDKNSDSDPTTKTAIVDKLLELIFRHSTTLGIRIYRRIPRAKLDRSTISVDLGSSDYQVLTTSSRRVNVKISKFKNGEIVSTKAEFEDCKRIMELTGIPHKIIAHQALLAASEKIRQDQENEKLVSHKLQPVASEYGHCRE